MVEVATRKPRRLADVLRDRRRWNRSPTVCAFTIMLAWGLVYAALGMRANGHVVHETCAVVWTGAPRHARAVHRRCLAASFGLLGDPFDRPSVTFRLLLGAVTTLIEVSRGFAAAVPGARDSRQVDLGFRGTLFNAHI